MESDNSDRLAWWREARFGMFIHWGLYAIPAGTWKGERIPGLGEWIMRNGRIPIAEYETLTKRFNPVQFDAEEWVQLAKRAGMRYLVITSKHHDGFCLFSSPSNPYNIVDATPFGRDPMAELADACRRHDIKLCFYYSQSQDWHAPGGAGHWETANDVKNWNKYPGTPEEFSRYLEAVVKPNLRELLTQYGPIGLIWFDTPVCITREQSIELRDLVHTLQPDCLVSGRIGNDVGDYGSMGDNQIPVGRVTGDWETPATLNDTWGYKSYDDNWKSLDTLLYLLADLAGKGVNYLLNVGPTAAGTIPPESVALLEGIGAWMAVNSEAIYGTEASPYPYEFEWGRMTAKGETLYLLITNWPEAPLHIRGLRNRVVSATLLAAPDTPCALEQVHDRDKDLHDVVITLPEAAPDPRVSVLRLRLDGSVDVDEMPQQQAEGSVCLPAHMATRDGSMTLSRTGVIEGWQEAGSGVRWTFRLHEAGTYRIEVFTAAWRPETWKGGHRLRFSTAGKMVADSLANHGVSTSPRARYFPEIISHLGEITLESPGCFEAELHLESLHPEDGAGPRLAEVKLVRLG